MEFDINLLKNTLCFPFEFQESIVVPYAYGLCEEQLLLSFVGSVTKKSDFYALEGQLQAELPFLCDKCLERVSFSLQLDVNENFIQKGAAAFTEIPPKEDFFYFEGERIDFTQAIETIVYLNIPPKIVCGESCKGLCPRCGHNLNQGDCGCDGVEIDPRFLVLHSFFNDKEV